MLFYGILTRLKTGQKRSKLLLSHEARQGDSTMSEDRVKYTTSTADPELYRHLTVPFATKSAQEQALEDFLGIVRAAREQCALPDVVVLVASNYIDDDKEVSDLWSFSMGSNDTALRMLWHGYASFVRAAREVFGEFGRNGRRGINYV